MFGPFPILLGAAALIMLGVGISATVSVGDGTHTAPTRAVDAPVLVTEHDGVRVWRVRDRSQGGSSWIYFATPVTRPTVIGEAGDRVPSTIDGR